MRKLKERKDGLDFIRERNQQIKQEIRERKQWKKSLINEYCKARTTDMERKRIVEMVKTADIMIRSYTKILEEHEAMLKELERI